MSTSTKPFTLNATQTEAVEKWQALTQKDRAFIIGTVADLLANTRHAGAPRSAIIALMTAFELDRK